MSHAARFAGLLELLGLLGLLCLLGCDAAGARYQPVLCSDSLVPCVDVRIVAHEDDDLLFMNPDLAASLAAGNRVVTVFVTAGTAGDPVRMTMRELGVLNAYAFMAEPSLAAAEPGQEAEMLASWRLHDGAPIRVDLGGDLVGDSRSAIQYDYVPPLPAGGLLSLVFLRVVERNGVDLGALLRGEVAQIPTVACATGCLHGSALDAQAYGKEQLVETLEALIERFEDRGAAGGLAVSTLDATQLHHREVGYGLGFIDHEDHLATAELAVAAFVRHHRRPYTAPQRLHQYRGYNIGRERANLGEEARGKRQVFYRYFVLGEPLEEVTEAGVRIENTNRDPQDPHFGLDTYEIWTERRYVLSSLPPERGRLAAGDPLRCLRASGGAAELGPCDGATRWDSARGRLRVVSDEAPCLELGGELASVAPCPAGGDGEADAGAERRSFVLTETGQIRTRGGGCLAADASGIASAACAMRVDERGDPIGRPVASQAWHWLLGG